MPSYFYRQSSVYWLEVKRTKFLQRSLSDSRKSRGSLELIVEVEKKKLDKAAARIRSFATITHVFDFIPYISFECGARDAEGIVKALTRGYSEIRSLFGRVEASAEFAIPEPRRVKVARAQSEELWNLSNIGAYAARQHSTGEGVKLAVIDTGIEYFHPEVKRNFGSVKGYDFVEGSDDPVDRNGHGTHVAGICAGLNYGVAIDSTLYAVRVLDANGSGSESDIIAGIEWCIKNGIHVANMSLGSPVASSAFEEICYVAAGKGLILVAAAGNDGGEFAMYPAAFGDPVVAVAAVDRYNRHADFSNIFSTNDVSGPGVDIPSSYIGGSYATFSGTSMASPHVAGAVALALPLIKNRDIYGLVDSTAEVIGSERDVFGAGLVRADGMVEKLLQRNRLPAALKAIIGAVW